MTGRRRERMDGGGIHQQFEERARLVRLERAIVAETPRGVAPGSVADRPPPDTAAWVVLCDQLFRESIGADCGGPAEDADAASLGYGPLIDRQEAAPGRWISVYAAS